MDGTAERQMGSATARLPERQREALESRELRGLSYDEIATGLGTTRECVGQLIAHGWINLYDELEGTILASVAPSPECERALGLIAARDDGELAADSTEGHWLDAHLEDCGRCRRGVEEMREARRRCRVDGTSAAARGRRHLPLVAGLLAFALLAGVATAFVRDEPPAASVEQAAGAAGALDVDSSRGANRKPSKEEGRSGATAVAGEADPVGAPAPEATGFAAPTASADPGGDGTPPSTPAQGRTGIEPTQRTASPRPTHTPKAAPPPPAPGPAPPPPTEPPVEEPADGPPHGREPPGKAVGHERR